MALFCLVSSGCVKLAAAEEGLMVEGDEGLIHLGLDVPEGEVGGRRGSSGGRADEEEGVVVRGLIHEGLDELDGPDGLDEAEERDVVMDELDGLDEADELDVVSFGPSLKMAEGP